MRATRHIEIAEPSGTAFRELVGWSYPLKEFLSPQEGEIGAGRGGRIVECLHEILCMDAPLGLSQPKRLVLVGFHEPCAHVALLSLSTGGLVLPHIFLEPQPLGIAFQGLRRG